MSRFVEIVEVGPRDGLQNEPRLIGTADKIVLVDLLSKAGFRRIEVASFVSPRRVPQMADGTAVLAGIERVPGVLYGALVPNLRGYQAAVAAEAGSVAVFASASEGFSRANLNCSVAESFERFAPVAQAAARDRVPLRGYVSCVTDCPFEGVVAPEAVARVVGRLFGMGCREISLGETLGRGRPEAVAAMLRAVVQVCPVEALAGHFHDTGGVALGNIAVALEAGLRVFDASAGGLGGCPYAPGAAGNVASEAVVDWLAAAGYETGVDRVALAAAGAYAKALRAG